MRWEPRRPPFFKNPTLYAQTVWPRATKFGTITHVGSSVFLGVSHAPSQSSGAQRSLKFLGLLHAHTETTTKFCTVIKPKMLTRDLFAEADILVRFSRHELCFSWDSDLLTIWGNMNWSHVGTVVRCYCCCRCRGRWNLYTDKDRHRWI